MVMKAAKLLLILFVTSTLSNITANAQTLQASLSHYSTDDGLSSNAVSDIVQDAHGYIWIATWNGLSRFDGFNFYNYEMGSQSRVPLLHNRILDLKVDMAQNIWLRMYDGRIFVLNRSTDRITNALENVTGYQEFKTNHPLTVTSIGDVFAIIDGIGVYKMRLEKNVMKTQLISTREFAVTSICEGYRNDLWAGTDKGIHRLNLSDETIEQKGEFTNEYIEHMYSNGFNIYAGTRSGKLVSFAYGQEAYVIKDFGESITSLFVDSHKLLWFTTLKQGISRLNLHTGDIKNYTQKVLVPQYDAKGAIIQEVNQTVWAIMNHGGFGYYNRATDEIQYFHNDPVNPWNLSNSVAAFLALPEGVIWESTSRRGLEKLEILKNTIQREQLIPDKDHSNINETRALYYDQQEKTLLIGNKSGALFAFKDGEKTAIAENGSWLGRIYDIDKDRHGNYWISSKGNGLIKMTPAGSGYTFESFVNNSQDQLSLNNNNVYSSVEDKEGNIWIATYGGGVNILTKTRQGKYIVLNKDNHIESYPRNAYQKVRSLAMDKNGKIWAGTTDGILIMTYKNRKVTIEKIKASKDGEYNLNSNDIICLACDKQGAMWIGTNGGGLSHSIGKDEDGNWQFKTFGGKDGLPSEEIKSITFDQRGNVWFATDHILCSYNTGKGIFSMFTIQDGVDDTVCSEGAAVTLPNGNILFGTLNGYYVVDRDKLVTVSGSMLKLRITDFYLDDELISPRLNDTYTYYIPESKKVKLPKPGSLFAFRFASLNYQLQHRVHYQYMLEGYDKEWINADKSRTVSYSDVPAGTYTFKVKAFLLESPETYDIKSIEVVVPPYFLLSSSAIWVYILLAVIAAALIVYYRRKRQARIAKMRVLKLGPQEMAFKHKEDYDFVKQQLDWLEEHYADSNLKIEDLVAQSSMSRTSYYNELKSLTGLSPKEFISDFRLKKALMYLDKSNNTIAEIAYNTGFNDPVYFTRIFKSKTGITPSKYRENKNKEENSRKEDTPK
jgi:ligand-binding sensor domain-containing protein/AraC-like DNA-binding protein